MLTMQLLIYASPLNMLGRNLQKKIKSMDVDTHSTYCASLEDLNKYLRQPIGVPPIGILIPSDDGELAALIGMRHLLRDMRLILILPAMSTPDIANTRAHMLRPRFISYADGNLADITAVLRKMKGHGCVRPSNGRLVESFNR
jgi:hypothetical protein